MTRSSRTRFWPVAFAAALLVGACTGGGATATPDEPEESTIFFGTGTTQAEVYLLPVLTYGREALADEGIALEYAALSGDEVVSAALDRGRIDVALLSLLGAQRAIAAGLDIRWTLTNETQNTFVLAVPGDVDDLSDLRGKKIGAGDVVVIAGPCSVESEEQLLETAHAVKASGASMLRGGAYKPRTSPYDFQGLGVEALRFLQKASRETGLPIETEVIS